MCQMINKISQTKKLFLPERIWWQIGLTKVVLFFYNINITHYIPAKNTSALSQKCQNAWALGLVSNVPERHFSATHFFSEFLGYHICLHSVSSSTYQLVRAFLKHANFFLLGASKYQNLELSLYRVATLI